MLTNKYIDISQELELKWMNYWLKNNIYKFDFNSKKPLYSIDPPPPTVNGNIHFGHVFSYSHFEMIARYKRLMGYNVFFPFGFDDNGLPSERLVEKENGIKARDLSREDFIKLCSDTMERYETEFKNLFNRLGFSVDWSLLYRTVDEKSIRISQRSFIELVEDKKAYYKEAPALWCSECCTSIAQAELETKRLKTTFNYITFKTTDDEPFTIATTRPELLSACVAVFINPNDKKRKHLVGKKAIVPLFDYEVPILEDEKVDIEKGTGMVMCCTFGDQTDIEWWKKYNLPLKNIFTNDGYIIKEITKYGGMKILEAREEIIKDLDTLKLVEKRETIEHEVQTHERCGKEIEFNVVKQWFIDILNHKKDFLTYGNKIKWYPSFMKIRYDNWVENIMWDWCISRQRYFGVPFPVWYCKNCQSIILADKDKLPVNPLVDKPTKTCTKCGSNDYISETDVMDTWATSSLTPLINMRWHQKDSLINEFAPMDLRPNAHDIIRTWDFYTIVKNYFHLNQIPWKNVMISGHALNNSNEKISKSKENTDTDPTFLIKKYSADAIRYWSASGRMGNNILFSEETLQRGQKLLIKLWNVAKFIIMHLEDFKDNKDFDNYVYMDKWILSKYQLMEKQFKKYLDNYEPGLGLNYLEKFFWNFCDNYIEIVKFRLYRPEELGVEARYSGQKVIYMLLHNLLQLFSIYSPFITEEIYQSYFKDHKSIHLTELKSLEYKFKEERESGDVIVDFISEIRGYKTTHNLSLKTEIMKVSIRLNEKLKIAFDNALSDIKVTLNIDDFNIELNNDIKTYEIKEIILKE